jgi:hypothetical protein
MRVPRWVWITAVSIVAVIVVSVGSFVVLASRVFGSGPEARCAGHERFQLTDWRDTMKVYGPLSIRGCMVDDLLATHDFHGRSRADIVGFLGDPPKTGYFREYDLVYWLGPERGFMSIDSEWLVFRLDTTQRVVEYRLVTD